MANEFIARKGLIVLNNGAKVTGSLGVLGDINATGYNVTASNLALLGSASIDGDITIGGNLTVGNADVDVVKFLAKVSSSIVPESNNTFDLGTGSKYWKDLYVSGTAYIGSVQATNINLDSITVLNNLTVDGDTRLGNSPTDRVTVTGSLSTTGIHTIDNTTNSTNYTNGALIVAGGVGIAKDVNISGSLTVTGLLTAVSMSTQYVTSSEYTIGTSRIILNDDDLVRFGGISVVDSGSTAATGSLLWDSLKNHWIYQREDGGPYKSSVVIAGPKNYGTLGDEEELVSGRIPVATGGDHIDTNAASSSIYIDFSNKKTYIEAGLYVTGSVTSSVGFAGDGSQLTGIVSNLNLSGSQGGTGTVALKTQALTISGSNGIAVTVNGQTVLVSGSNATTTVRGVAAFTGSNFAVAGGVVSSNPINFNGADINLGGTHAFGLQNITPYGASTTDQVSLQGGAIINGVLFTSASNSDVDTGTEIVASISTITYDSAFFDYVVKQAGNMRTGTVMAVWESGTSNVEFTDTSTNDLGSTADIIFTVDILSNTARLKATAASDNWTVRTAVRAF